MHKLYNREFIYQPPASALSLIYEDSDVLVVNKPNELLSVPGKAAHHRDSLLTRVQTEYRHALLVHRLDMATSGLIVFALNRHAQRHLGLQFEKRYIKKTYAAHVWGKAESDTGHINLPLLTDWPNRPLQHVDFENGKSSQTDWEVLKRSAAFTQMHLYPRTGRSHQLRVHMREIGHPILGDRLYAPDAAYEASHRLCLHAYKLGLRHPDGGRSMEFVAPIPF
jgi:tRNA pseudouridine32 synthase/23S rRNA pseudouridine746 synthase